MWTVHARFRFGSYTFSEIDITPALGLSLIVSVFALIVRTGL
jgi:hypothetical protein